MLFNFDPAVRLVLFSFTGAIDAICGTVCDSIRCAMSSSWLCDCWVSLFNSLLSCFVSYRNHILRHNVSPQNKRWSREEYSLCLWAQDDLFKTKFSLYFYRAFIQLQWAYLALLCPCPSIPQQGHDWPSDVDGRNDAGTALSTQGFHFSSSFTRNCTESDVCGDNHAGERKKWSRWSGSRFFAAYPTTSPMIRKAKAICKV